MADIEAAVAAPPLAPPTRRAVRAAAALGLLLGLAAQAATYGLMGALWMASAANAARITARRLYGADSRAAAVAVNFLGASLVATGLFFAALSFVIAALGLVGAVLDLLLPWRRASRKGEAREIGGDGGATMLASQGRDPESRGARDRPVAKQIVVVLFVVMAVGLLMVLFAPAMGSCEQRVGSMLVDIGSFLISLWFCLVIPKDAIQVTAGMAWMQKGCVELAFLCMNPSSVQDSQFFVGQEISLGRRG